MKAVRHNSSAHHTGKPNLMVAGAVALALMFGGLTALSDAIQANAIRQATGGLQR